MTGIQGPFSNNRNLNAPQDSVFEGGTSYLDTTQDKSIENGKVGMNQLLEASKTPGGLTNAIAGMSGAEVQNALLGFANDTMYSKGNKVGELLQKLDMEGKSVSQQDPNALAGLKLLGQKLSETGDQGAETVSTILYGVSAEKENYYKNQIMSAPGWQNVPNMGIGEGSQTTLDPLASIGNQNQNPGMPQPVGIYNQDGTLRNQQPPQQQYPQQQYPQEYYQGGTGGTNRQDTTLNNQNNLYQESNNYNQQQSQYDQYQQNNYNIFFEGVPSGGTRMPPREEMYDQRPPAYPDGRPRYDQDDQQRPPLYPDQPRREDYRIDEYTGKGCDHDDEGIDMSYDRDRDEEDNSPEYADYTSGKVKDKDKIKCDDDEGVDDDEDEDNEDKELTSKEIKQYAKDTLAFLGDLDVKKGKKDPKTEEEDNKKLEKDVNSIGQQLANGKTPEGKPYTEKDALAAMKKLGLTDDEAGAIITGQATIGDVIAARKEKSDAEGESGQLTDLASLKKKMDDLSPEDRKKLMEALADQIEDAAENGSISKGMIRAIDFMKTVYKGEWESVGKKLAQEPEVKEAFDKSADVKHSEAVFIDPNQQILPNDKDWQARLGEANKKEEPDNKNEKWDSIKTLDDGKTEKSRTEEKDGKKITTVQVSDKEGKVLSEVKTTKEGEKTIETATRISDADGKYHVDTKNGEGKFVKQEFFDKDNKIEATREYKNKKIGDKDTPVYEEKNKDGKLTKDFVQYKVVKDGDKEKVLDTAWDEIKDDKRVGTHAQEYNDKNQKTKHTYKEINTADNKETGKTVTEDFNPENGLLSKKVFKEANGKETTEEFNPKDNNEMYKRITREPDGRENIEMGLFKNDKGEYHVDGNKGGVKFDSLGNVKNSDLEGKKDEIDGKINDLSGKYVKDAKEQKDKDKNAEIEKYLAQFFMQMLSQGQNYDDHEALGFMKRLQDKNRGLFDGVMRQLGAFTRDGHKDTVMGKMVNEFLSEAVKDDTRKDWADRAKTNPAENPPSAGSQFTHGLNDVNEALKKLGEDSKASEDEKKAAKELIVQIVNGQLMAGDFNGVNQMMNNIQDKLQGMSGNPPPAQAIINALTTSRTNDDDGNIFKSRNDEHYIANGGQIDKDNYEAQIQKYNDHVEGMKGDKPQDQKDKLEKNKLVHK